MPTLGQLLGDNLYNVAYGPQYNAMKRKQALDDSGYIPSENDGLIDSFQSGLAGSMGGLFGELSGWAKNNGHDWLANEAMYGANQIVMPIQVMQIPMGIYGMVPTKPLKL